MLNIKVLDRELLITLASTLTYTKSMQPSQHVHSQLESALFTSLSLGPGRESLLLCFHVSRCLPPSMELPYLLSPLLSVLPRERYQPHYESVALPRMTFLEIYSSLKHHREFFFFCDIQETTEFAEMINWIEGLWYSYESCDIITKKINVKS